MRFHMLAIVTLATLGLTQPACAREPAESRTRDASPATVLSVASISAGCEDPAVALDSAISRTIAAVQGGDAATFLGLVSDDGVSFNPDGGHVGFRSLQNQLDGKSGQYCALFGCAGQPASLGAKFKRGPIDKQIDAAHGLATVFINANTNDELDLTYKLRECRWELTGVSAVE